MARLNNNVLRTIAAVSVIGISATTAAPANALPALPDPGEIIAGWQRNVENLTKRFDRAETNDLVAQAQRDIEAFLAAAMPNDQAQSSQTVAQNIAATLDQLGGVMNQPSENQHSKNQQFGFVGAPDTQRFIDTLKANADDLGSMMLSVVKSEDTADDAEITMLIQKKDGSTVVNVLDNLPAKTADALAAKLYELADQVAAHGTGRSNDVPTADLVAGLDQARLTSTAAQAAAAGNQPVLDAASAQMDDTTRAENTANTDAARNTQLVTVTVNFAGDEPTVTTAVSDGATTRTVTTDDAGAAQDGLVRALRDVTGSDAVGSDSAGSDTAGSEPAPDTLLESVADVVNPSSGRGSLSEAMRDALAKLERGEAVDLSTFSVADLQSLLDRVSSSRSGVAPATTTPGTAPADTVKDSTAQDGASQDGTVVVTVAIDGTDTREVEVNVAVKGDGADATGTSSATDTPAGAAVTTTVTVTVPAGAKLTSTVPSSVAEPAVSDPDADARASAALTSAVMAQAQQLNAQATAEPVSDAGSGAGTGSDSAGTGSADAYQQSGSAQAGTSATDTDTASTSSAATATVQPSATATSSAAPTAAPTAQEDLAVTGSDSSTLMKVLLGLGVLALIAAAGGVWTVQRDRRREFEGGQ